MNCLQNVWMTKSILWPTDYSFDEKLNQKASASAVVKLQEDVNILQEKQKYSEGILDKIERENLLDRLIVSGIPYVSNEDLISISNRICLATGCKIPIASAFRLKSFVKTDVPTTSNAGSSKMNPTPPIIFKFFTPEQRFDFFHCYHTFKILNLKHVGFGTEQRIYINELLTKRNYEIQYLARKLKELGKISKYHSSRGIVHVSRLVNGKLVSQPIYDKTKLSSLDLV